ncbi:MAG: 5-formyltetrahydrofolate cyclo-ligase [Alphaproteobacteria bacterium]
MISDANSAKQALRIEAKSLARQLAAMDTSAALKDCFLERFSGKPRTIGGFYPLSDEPNTLPLLSALHDRGWRIGLPVVAEDKPLCFHEWVPGDALGASNFGTAEPDAASPIVVPDIVLVPLLAFSDKGDRLGRGAGFYDRTLSELRAKRDVIAIGVAYTEQKLDFIPTDAHDQQMDAVLTEYGFEDFRKADL